jgi:hypothetical protein
MKIIIIVFGRLRNEAHYEFFVVFNDLLIRFPAVMALVNMFYPDFLTLLDKEMHLTDAAKKSPLTERLATADKRIDRNISAIRKIVKAMTSHFDANVADAARQLNIRIKSVGDVYNKPYLEESAAVQLLVEDFKTKFAQQVETVGITAWIDELSMAETEFVALFEQRNSVEAERPQEKMTDIRKEIESVYRKMIVTIQSDLNINGNSTSGEFAAELNGRIKYFNEHAHHRKKNDVADATIASIPEQIYTGKQIIVIPEVWYKDNQLVLATDFNVMYQNNIMPGNAQLIISGKGDFEGQKIITFYINELRIEG